MPIAQDADQLPRLENLDVAVQIHGMVEEQVTGKHGNGDAVPHSAPSGPGLDLGEKRVKSLGGQLVTDKLLAVAFSPQGIPLPCRRCRAQALIGRRDTRSRSLCHEVFWQGSAPFGSDRVLRPDHRHRTDYWRLRSPASMSRGSSALPVACHPEG